MIFTSSILTTIFISYFLDAIQANSNDTSTTHHQTKTTTTHSTTIAANLGIKSSSISSNFIAATVAILSSTSIPSRDKMTSVNSTATEDEKSLISTEMLIAMIVGAVALVILIIAVIIYILMKKGYIKIFNHQSRRPMKSDDQTRMIDSASTIDRQSPSQRNSNTT